MEAMARNPLREGLMRIWRIVVPGLFGLALAGCRNDPSIELLERDNFKKEQEIYRLRDENAELKEALSAGSPAQPNILRGVPAGEMPPEPGTSEGSRSAPVRPRPAPPFTSPGRTNPEPETPASGGLNISPGMEVPPGEVPDRMRVPGDTAPSRPISPPGES